MLPAAHGSDCRSCRRWARALAMPNRAPRGCWRRERWRLWAIDEWASGRRERWRLWALLWAIEGTKFPVAVLLLDPVFAKAYVEGATTRLNFLPRIQCPRRLVGLVSLLFVGLPQESCESLDAMHRRWFHRLNEFLVQLKISLFNCFCCFTASTIPCCS